MLLIGRGFSFANCLEGALKIKVRLHESHVLLILTSCSNPPQELTYMHAEGLLAGFEQLERIRRT